MEKLIRTALLLLFFGNVAMPWLQWHWTKQATGSSVRESIVHPELLMSALRGASPKALDNKGVCMQIDGLTNVQATQAREIFASSNSKSFPGQDFAWTVSWQIQKNKAESDAKLRELSLLGIVELEQEQSVSGWQLKSKKFDSEQAARSLLAQWAKSGAKTATVSKGQEAAYQSVRFGPWPESEINTLAGAAKSWGAARVRACNEQERLEWENSK